MKIELAALRPHPQNYNRHPAAQVGKIKASLARFGQRKPITTWRGMVLTGHGVFEAARALGWAEIWAEPCPEEWTEAEALAWLAADNELARGADPDDDALAALVAGLKDVDAELAALAAGTDERLMELMASIQQGQAGDDPGAQVDKAAELQAKWGTATGQLWALGEHWLICGDAKVAGLVGDFAIFDPPWDWSASQYDDAMGWVSWKKACCMGLSEMFPLASRADYRCFWFWDQLTGVNISNQSPFLPMRSCVVLFDFGDAKRFYATEALRVLHKIGVCENHQQSAPQYVPIVRRYQDGKEAMHSDVKPAVLCDYIVTLYSKRGEIVVDPFAGSGSFLLSSHRLGRQWQGSEIDPANCAVILERFYDATGITPQRSDADHPVEAV